MLKQAVILVSGLDARLDEQTRSVPKPLLDVAGKPFLDYILDEVSRYASIESIILLAGHPAEQLIERYEGRRWRGASVSVVFQPEQLGTGGALKRVAPRLENKFFLLNGGTFFDFNLLDLAAEAVRSSAVVHMALKRYQVGDHHGRVMLEGEVVKSFLPAGAHSSGPIDSGVYCVDREIFSFIDETPCSLEQRVFPLLVEHAQLKAAVYDGFFVNIDIAADFERAQRELPEMIRRPAVFFDRDGVLNVDKAYVYRIEDFGWIAGAREAIKLCNDRGYLAFVVTNQSGVARGYYGVDDINRLHDWMSRELAKVGAHIEEFQYCPYHEEGTVEEFRRASDRRKPAPGMILDCLKTWPVRKESSLLIGDNPRDVEAAVAAGIPGHLFEGGDLLTFVRPLLGPRAG